MCGFLVVQHEGLSVVWFRAHSGSSFTVLSIRFWKIGIFLKWDFLCWPSEGSRLIVYCFVPVVGKVYHIVGGLLLWRNSCCVFRYFCHSILYPKVCYTIQSTVPTCVNLYQIPLIWFWSTLIYSKSYSPTINTNWSTLVSLKEHCNTIVLTWVNFITNCKFQFGNSNTNKWKLCNTQCSIQLRGKQKLVWTFSVF